jgi:hypothetical protein
MAPRRTNTRAQDCGKAEAKTRLEDERSRSDNHRDAVNLVKQVTPGGAAAGSRLQRLLSLKDESQYGFGGMGAQKHEAAIRQAKALVEFAEQTLQR